MKVLSVHTHYQQPGGEDESAASEVTLMRSRGHDVVEYREHNDRVEELSRLRVAARTVWSDESYDRVRKLIRDTRPDVMHVQNFFPLISPSVYYAAAAEHVPVVQSLRNYRLLCVNAQFFRDGRVCEDCLGRAVAWPGVVHACYRGSRAASAVVASMASAHRALGTWTHAVAVYVAMTEFSRQKFIQGGLPAGRLVVKPNFVDPDPGYRSGPRHHALFVGRFSPEKGIWTLLRAWQRRPGIPLLMIGDGPLYPDVERFIREEGLGDSVRLLGRTSRARTMEIMSDAGFLVFPSECHETFGRVAVEAFACGVPVLASRLDALADTVKDGRTGVLFGPGNAEELYVAARALVADESRRARLGLTARHEYESRYSADANYPLLLSIYNRAIAHQTAPAGAESASAVATF